MTRPPDDEALLGAAREAAFAGAEVHREMTGRFRESEWEEKGRADFVTEVDLEAERRIVRALRSRFPEHAVLAEEGTADAGAAASAGPAGPDAPVRWIIDPLDGTTNWLHGYPEHAVSVAAEDGEGLRVAVVVNSATGETFEAVRGGGSRRNGRPIRVSGVRFLRNALVGTGFPFKKLDLLPDYLAAFSRVLASTSGIRRAGAAALDLCDLACGRFDAFFEYWLMPWDVAGGALIVREAGGVFERLPLPTERPGEASDAGGPADSVTGAAGELVAGGFLAANPSLIAEFRALVRGAA